MKKFFILFAAVVAVIAIVVISITLYSRHEASLYENTAVPYIKMVVPEISKWDAEIIKQYMPAETLKDTSEERIIRVVEYLSRLGALQSMQEPKFTKLYTAPPVDGVRKKIVTYSIDTVYEQGDAVFSLDLLVNGDTFAVYKFDINSLVLLK